MQTTTTIFQSSSALFCSSGAMAIAFTVFVMLTVLLAAFIILLFAIKPFRQFLFRKDYETKTADTTPAPEQEAVENAEAVIDVAESAQPVAEPEPVKIIEPVVEAQTEQPRPRPTPRTITRSGNTSRVSERTARRPVQSDDGIPTVPLEPVTENDRTSVINEIAEKRRASGNTFDDIRTIEIPQTTPLTAPRRPDQGKFVTTTPRRRTLDGDQLTNTRPAPPRASVTRTRSRDNDKSTDDKN